MRQQFPFFLILFTVLHFIYSVALICLFSWCPAVLKSTRLFSFSVLELKLTAEKVQDITSSRWWAVNKVWRQNQKTKPSWHACLQAVAKKTVAELIWGLTFVLASLHRGEAKFHMKLLSNSHWIIRLQDTKTCPSTQGHKINVPVSKKSSFVLSHYM